MKIIRYILVLLGSLVLMANVEARSAGELISKYDKLPENAVPTTTPDNNPAKIEVSAFSPNPFRNEAIVTITLLEPGKLKVRVLNANGREMMVLFNGKIPDKNITLNISGESLEEGVYFILAQHNGYSAVKKIIKVR